MNKKMNNQSPCVQECAERSPTCHAECEKYLAWVESRKPELEARAEKQRAENGYINYVNARNERLRRFRRKKQK